MRTIKNPRSIALRLMICLYGWAIVLAPSLLMMVAVLLIWFLLLNIVSMRWVKAMVVFCLIYSLILESAILTYMIYDGWSTPTYSGSETLIIPGAAVVGNRPGSFLKSRLDTALDILKTNETISVVVSGGKSPEDRIGEAQTMRQYLEGRGIDGNRIYEEPRGYDTIRNMEYSKEVIRKNGLSFDVIIVSNEFHNFRINSIARAVGLRPTTVPTVTPEKHLMRYLVREIASLIKVQLHYGLTLK